MKKKGSALKMTSFKEFEKDILKNPAIRQAYEDLEPEFAILERIIRKRNEEGMTQADLAKKIGTKQSAISRFEAGKYNPTLSFLQKIARALDAKLTVTIL